MSKYEILSQTGIAALAQADRVQQEVTKLLTVIRSGLERVVFSTIASTSKKPGDRAAAGETLPLFFAAPTCSPRFKIPHQNLRGGLP